MKSPKILIVDDEPFNIDYLEQELEEKDYRLISAVNGQEALDKVRAELPDLVLLDIMMPVMDGFEVLSHLKADPVTRDIPVIVISASSDLRSMVRGIQMGAEDYLPKPFETILLHARISSSLEKKRLHDLQQLYLKSLEREMEIAREIQAGFLPADLPQVAGWQIAAYFKAARDVAGDFYDAFSLSDGSLVFVVGDVCGKGVGAALFMTLFRSLIRAASTTGVFHTGKHNQQTSTAERLQQVISFTNEYIADTHGDSSIFATVFIGCINPQNGGLTYINCGNEPAIVLRDGAVAASLNPTGPVVGIMAQMLYPAKEFHLEQDDLLVAFTDGIPDSQNAAEEFFGRDRLMSALLSPAANPASLIETIRQRMEQFCGAAQQFDDVTLVALKRGS